MKKFILLSLSFCMALICIKSNAQNSLAVTVFHDLDGNGLEDLGEPTIAGVLTTELRLWQDIDNNGAINAGDVEFMHDGGIGGVYTFGAGNILPDDNYILEYVEMGVPGAYYVTQLVNGVGTLDMDNDLDPMFNTAGFPLSGDTPEMFIDLGLVIAGNIGSYTWHDQNGDGLQDPGEPALDGVNVTLLNAITMAPVVNDINFLPLTNPMTTAGGGVYSFDNLPPGQYIIEFQVPTPSPDLWYPTKYTADDDATDVLNDSDANNNSASPNYLQSHTIILLSDETDEEDKIDAGFFQASIIGDMVWEDLNGDGIQDPGEPGLNGVTVSLLDDMGNPAIGADGLAIPDQITTNMGLDGQYQFMLVAPGDYQVQFSLPAPIGGVSWYPTEFDPSHMDSNDPDLDSDANNDSNDPDYLKSHIINIVSNEEINGNSNEDTRIDAGFWLPVNVGNMVFCDENGNGINDDGVGGVDGVDVRLIETSTGLTAQDAEGNILTATTFGGGMYSFKLVPPGFYRLEFAFTAVTPDPPFSFTLQDDPNGIGGGIDLDDSDVDQFGGVDPIGQTIEFEVISQDMEEEEKWDAGVYQEISILGNIWIEDDMNNTNDVGELGPGGVFLELFNADDDSKVDDTFTIGGGQYEFEGIPPGNYYIVYNVAGTSLENATPCPGVQDANDMVDNDDNGNDSPMVKTTDFTLLSNCDPATPPEVLYIDFCYFFDCNDENSLASESCDLINNTDIICDIAILGSFCNLMPTGNSPGIQPTPLCPDGGAPHNMSWFAFVAYGGNYSVVVTPTTCTGSSTGVEGVQIGLYTDCSFSEEVYCNSNCSTNPVSFDSSILEEGQTYYFFIDGCSGSVCSYEVEISGAPIAPSLIPQDVCIVDPNGGDPSCADATFCPDAMVDFIATDFNLTVDFSWSITALSDGPYTEDPTPMTQDEILSISFPNEGVYEVCLTKVDNGCSAQQWNGQICRIVTIEGIDDELFDPETICEEDKMMFDPAVLEDEDAPNPMDPNGDGTLGWQGPSMDIVFGENNFPVITDQGCMYEQSFELLKHPESAKGLFKQTLCPDDLPLMVDAINITELSFLGETKFVLQDYLLANESDVNGCDSVIDISLEVLTILDGSLSLDQCLPEGVIINFTYNDNDTTLSTHISFFTFEWFDPMGIPLPDDFWQPMDPKNNIAPISIGDGTYSLTITVTKNGVSCTFDYSIDIDFSDFFPPQPNISGPGMVVCEADSIVTYTATDFGNAFSFVWDVPSDVASSTISGAQGEMITINWSGSTGGMVSLTTMNACGTAEVEIPITVIPQPTPEFNIIPEVCVDSCTIIEYNGDESLIASWNWDFDGGTENNGTGSVGPGPHCVSWSDAGEKTITLSYIDNDGCKSAITTEIVSVIDPITPPLITCNPNTGEVSFTWDDVPGNLGYDVEVTSISAITGLPHEGVLSGTTFTVGNLNESEIVTIIVTIFTDDACQMITSVSQGCTAQDCIAPNIELNADITSFCLDENSGTTTITPTIISGENGTGVFSGSGIVDPDNGIFDPDSANIGINTITYVFMTDDMPVPCIGNGTIQIEVLETPVASFVPDVDTICINDQFTLTYDGTAGVNDLIWDPGVGGSSTGGNMPIITYTTPGEKTISLTVEKDGCISESFEFDVVVEPELPPIDVICLNQQTDMVEFGWNSIPGATGYEVTVGTDPPFITTGTTHLETGLNPDEVVTITVTVLTDNICGGSTDTQDCQAQDCPTFMIEFANDELAECIDAAGSNQEIDLDLETIPSATGGMGGGDFIWSGQNVSGNLFDPNGLTEGFHTVFVTYGEGTCENSDSIRIQLTTIPTAAFSVDNTTICVGETVNITYEGSQLPGQTIEWTPSGLVVDGANPNEYEATFNTEGVFDIQLDVQNGNCTTTPATATITVEPELQFNSLDCTEGMDNIIFSWDPVDCASEYEVYTTLLPGGTEQLEGTQTTTTFEISDLGVNQEVQIRVVAISDCACEDIQNVLTCQTGDCTAVQLSLFTMDGDTEFCLTEDLGTIEIMADEIGTQGSGVGTWSGPGIIDPNNGVFDPAVAGVGTHTIVYDFLESEGCPYQESIEITINGLPDVTAQATELLCYDQTTTTLEIMPTGGDGEYTITMNDSDANLINEVSPGNYNIIVTDGNSCTNTTSITIDVPAEPTISISGSELLILGDSSTYSINANVFEGNTIDSVVWTANGTVLCNDPGCFSLDNQTPSELTVYDVTVYYNGSCSVTAASLTVEVEVVEPPLIFIIPNIISPNDDGENDEWSFVTNNDSIIINSIKVFDRWGSEVWEFEGPVSAKENTPVWDGKYKGKILQPGVYVYFVNYDDDKRKNRIRSGDITIIN